MASAERSIAKVFYFIIAVLIALIVWDAKLRYLVSSFLSVVIEVSRIDHDTFTELQGTSQQSYAFPVRVERTSRLGNNKVSPL